MSGAGVGAEKYDLNKRNKSVKETSAVRNKAMRTERQGGGKANRKTPASDTHTRSVPKVSKWVC